MAAAQNGRLDCVKLLAKREKGMKDKYNNTALYYTFYDSSNRECAEFLWWFPEERDTDRLDWVKEKWGFTTTCPNGAHYAGSLFDAAWSGCPECV